MNRSIPLLMTPRLQSLHAAQRLTIVACNVALPSWAASYIAVRSACSRTWYLRGRSSRAGVMSTPGGMRFAPTVTSPFWCKMAALVWVDGSSLVQASSRARSITWRYSSGLVVNRSVMQLS